MISLPNDEYVHSFNVYTIYFAAGMDVYHSSITHSRRSRKLFSWLPIDYVYDNHTEHELTYNQARTWNLT